MGLVTSGTPRAFGQSAGGLLADVASDGDPTAVDTAMQILKQLTNTLEGTVGIVVYPAAAAPGNGVSLAEVLRQVYDDVTGIGGVAMRGTDDAALAVVLGALADAASDGDPTAVDTAMQILKQLVNTLEGTAGIVVYPAAAAPGNGVSLAEVLREIFDDVTGLAGSVMRGTDSAALAVVLGALADAASDGDPTAVDTAMQILKQLVNTLEGTAGIVAWAAGAAPGNGVSLAEAIRFIAELVDSAEAVGPFSYLDAGGEQTVTEDVTLTTRRRVSIEFDLTTMTQDGTIRLYRKVDGTTFGLYDESTFLQAGAENVFDFQFTTNQHWQLTYQEAMDEGAARAIPFNVITEEIE